MELPQPRPFGTEGPTGRKPTHDFLSLYSPVMPDPKGSQGGYLKTHDFLQPLEQVGKNIDAEEKKVAISTVAVKPPAPAALSGEHILPGGIGTYSISHISYINNQRVLKPEGVMYTVAQASSSDKNDENSNCSSYTGSGFTLWEESAVKKGKTGKENISEDRHGIKDAEVNIGGGQWPTSLEGPSPSSSNHNPHSTNFSSRSSSRLLSHKNQSFMDMIKSARGNQEDEVDDDEEFVIKKEPSPQHKGNISVRIDGKGNDHKPNTPRSKHSATEQRRRSKINDRFQMLRDLIPHGDQKRDKASFLLEVIEYIQFLQEKVNKYESYQGWNHEPPKLMTWRNSNGPPEGFVDQSRGLNCGSGPAAMFATKFDENNVIVSPTTHRSGQTIVESNMNTADTFKEMDHRPGLLNKTSSLPVMLQPKIFSSGGSSSATVALPPLLSTGVMENRASQPESQVWGGRSCMTDCTVVSDKLKDEELTIESGTINISSVYSQGLLNTLTQALHSSGVDLSHASISVQIDLGKRANSTLNSSTSVVKDDVLSSNPTLVRSRLASTEVDPDQALKRQKIGRG